MKSKAALLLAWGVMVGGAVVCGACGGGDESGRAAATPATTATSATIAATAVSPTEEAQRAVSGARGIGVYPAEIDFGETLRAGEYFRTIGVLNNEHSEQAFRFEFDGEGGSVLSVVDPDDRTQVLDVVHAPSKDQARVFLRLPVAPRAPHGR